MIITDLLDFYYKLDNDAKIILRAKALIYHSCSNETLHKLLQRAEVYKFHRRRFHLFEIKTIIQYLRNNQLLETNDNLCNHLIIHNVTKDAIKDPRFKEFPQILKKEISFYSYYYMYFERLLRDARILIYSNKYPMLEKLLSLPYFSDLSGKKVWSKIISDIPEDIGWLELLDNKLRETIIYYQVKIRLHKLLPCKNLVRYLEQSHSGLNQLLAEYYLLTGDFLKAQNYATQIPAVFEQLAFQGTLLFCSGKINDSLKYYEDALKRLKKDTKKRNIFLDGLHGVFYILGLIASDDANKLLIAERGIQTVLKYAEDHQDYKRIFFAFQALINFLRLKHKDLAWTTINSKLCEVFIRVIQCWLEPNLIKSKLPYLTQRFQEIEASEYKFIANIYAEILNEYSSSEYENYYKSNKLRFLTLCKKREYWDRALECLSSMHQKQSDSKRLIWLLDPEATWDYLAPIAQKATQEGWSKGSKANLNTLYKLKDLFTEQDRKIYEALQVYRYEENEENKILPLFIGHPHLYHMRYPNLNIILEESKPELIIKEIPDGFNFKLAASDKPTVILKKEALNRYKLIEIKESHVQLQSILTEKGLTVPSEAKDRALETIKGLADIVTIYSAVEINDVPLIKADSKLQVQLSPLDNGLYADILTRPFGDYGPYCTPGKGNQVILTVQNGEKVQIKRELNKEADNLKKLIASCPSLQDKTTEWMFPTAQKCLNLLSELKAYPDDIQLIWPKGESFKLKAKLSVDNLNLKITGSQDWFELEGDVEINSQKLMDMQTLLNLINDNPYIDLGNGEFLNLTEHFKKQLQSLKGLTSDNRIHKLGAFALEDVINEFSKVEMDTAWKTQVEKIRSIQKIEPKIPKQLEATLRPYQKEGFNWLCRLAHLEVGACLADDMGLGKTVQAIAVLQDQSNKGPSLVIAPTSVCHNWINEIKRFAPLLKTYFLGELDREKLVKRLKKQEIVICSYGLLQISKDLLTQLKWQIIILDEAQAIKNSTTKRAKIAYQLQSEFKIALTGTPIENHLGELWSLFRFINPGLLGTEKNFFQKFTIPIEKNNDKIAREALKKIIQPFILRRIKNDVLKDLPPRIEKKLEIRLSDEETAFYEALRQKALKNIQEMDNEQPGQKRVKILAEITKLRQACCHPVLVNPEIGLSSSKLKHFERLLDDILANEHKILIFSQFVRYLKIICDLLQKKEINYQYLDGSTTIKKRKQFIESFQNGEGDVFLLSLKAGGVGLNLTAADYVILLDPWWNPAVEDQAADRAHRIGQKKAVTIYRLINQHTIEEKIISMHQYKRNLANNLLSNANIAGKLSEEQLVALIKET